MNVDRFIERLAAVPSTDTLCNFYADRTDGFPARRAALRAHLMACCDADIVLVGEAPGYRGARLSGVPFTSQHQLHGHGRREATATIVHETLDRLGLSGRVLLWNIVPFHPHRSGLLESNRKPTKADCSAGLAFLDDLTIGRRVVAVGRVAERWLPTAIPVRHPSYGGRGDFERQMAVLV